LPKITKKCLICGESFSTYKIHSKFCSRKCYVIYWKDNIMKKCLENSLIFKIGRTPWNKGKHIQTNTGRTHFKKGLIPWNKGLTKEIDSRVNTPKTIFKNGYTSDRRGKKWEDIYEKNALESFNNRFRIKENHPSWMGGKSLEKYGDKFTKELKEFIRKRDNFMCVECNLTEKKLKYRLSVHHIDYDKKNCDPNNLISLCKSCHQKTNFKRKDWVRYFKNKL